ncbi:MAG: hypothetical protein FJ387_01535 [Verrucomicrobia bacterium]|nr:hypothetical protein [Verrucomicrobiota bacterium]
MKTWLALGFAGALCALAGCATTPPAARWPRTGDPLVDGRTAIAQGPSRDRALWQYRTAATALRRGQRAEAAALLDEALLSIGGMVGRDKDARKARGLFHEESRKTFLGEPYERVMAYYYRGILYWMDGELDNARACFRSGQLTDSDTENQEYSADYLLLDYLEGLTTAKLGGDGADSLKRALAAARLWQPPAYDPGANVVVFAEYGTGPTKYATGEYREQLRFRPGNSGAASARLRVGNQVLRLEPYDDLNFQATTRGGRVMDHILGNKAVFKSATDAVGDAALISGLILAHGRQTRDAGLGLAAAGLVSKLISAATTPAADTRAWDNLPQYLSFAACRLPPGEHAATVEFLKDSASQIVTLTKTIAITVPDLTRDTVVFVSDKNH